MEFQAADFDRIDPGNGVDKPAALDGADVHSALEQTALNGGVTGHNTSKGAALDGANTTTVYRVLKRAAFNDTAGAAVSGIGILHRSTSKGAALDGAVVGHTVFEGTAFDGGVVGHSVGKGTAINDSTGVVFHSVVKGAACNGADIGGAGKVGVSGIFYSSAECAACNGAVVCHR